MAAYNAVNGTPAHVHPMLHDVVVREWGVDGIVCTDGGGLRLLVSDHKAFPDLPSAAAACVKAGINHFLDRHQEPVAEAVAKGLLTEAEIDRALRGLFRVSLKLGLLDPPERVPYAGDRRRGRSRSPGRSRRRGRSSARPRGSRSCCSRTPRGSFPSTATKVGSVAIVGPLANVVLADWYGGTPPYAVTPKDGIERVANPGPPGAPGTVGINWAGDMSDAAVEIARKRKVAIVVVGSHPEGNAGWEEVTSPSEGKEAVDRKSLELPPGQEDFIRRVDRREPAHDRGARDELPGRAALGRGERRARSCTSPTRARSSATRWAT